MVICTLHSRFNEEGPIKLNDLWRNSAVEDIKFHDDTV